MLAVFFIWHYMRTAYSRFLFATFIVASLFNAEQLFLSKDHMSSLSYFSRWFISVCNFLSHDEDRRAKLVYDATQGFSLHATDCQSKRRTIT